MVIFPLLGLRSGSGLTEQLDQVVASEAMLNVTSFRKDDFAQDFSGTALLKKPCLQTRQASHSNPLWRALLRPLLRPFHVCATHELLTPALYLLLIRLKKKPQEE